MSVQNSAVKIKSVESNLKTNIGKSGNSNKNETFKDLINSLSTNTGSDRNETSKSSSIVTNELVDVIKGCASSKLLQSLLGAQKNSNSASFKVHSKAKLAPDPAPVKRSLSDSLQSSPASKIQCIDKERPNRNSLDYQANENLMTQLSSNNEISSSQHHILQPSSSNSSIATPTVQSNDLNTYLNSASIGIPNKILYDPHNSNFSTNLADSSTFEQDGHTNVFIPYSNSRNLIAANFNENNLHNTQNVISSNTQFSVTPSNVFKARSMPSDDHFVNSKMSQYTISSASSSNLNSDHLQTNHNTHTSNTNISQNNVIKNTVLTSTHVQNTSLMTNADSNNPLSSSYVQVSSPRDNQIKTSWRNYTPTSPPQNFTPSSPSQNISSNTLNFTQHKIVSETDNSIIRDAPTAIIPHAGARILSTSTAQCSSLLPTKIRTFCTVSSTSHTKIDPYEEYVPVPPPQNPFNDDGPEQKEKTNESDLPSSVSVSCRPSVSNSNVQAPELSPMNDVPENYRVGQKYHIIYGTGSSVNAVWNGSFFKIQEANAETDKDSAVDKEESMSIDIDLNKLQELANNEANAAASDSNNVKNPVVNEHGDDDLSEDSVTVMSGLESEEEEEPDGIPEQGEGDEEVTTLKNVTSVYCPITQRVMVNPVKNVRCNHSYDKQGVEMLIAQRGIKARCPMPWCSSTIPLIMSDMIEDSSLHKLLEDKK